MQILYFFKYKLGANASNSFYNLYSNFTRTFSEGHVFKYIIYKMELYEIIFKFIVFLKKRTVSHY